MDIYNLWYPESIESKMYSRLMQRSDLFELAVGEFPDVVGTAIRDQLAGQFGFPSENRDVIYELNALKNDTQIRALRTLWDRNVVKTTLTGRFRMELVSLAIAAARGAGASISQEGSIFRVTQDGETVTFSVEPGRNDVINLRHPALRWLASTENRRPDFASILSEAGGPLFFATPEGPVDPMTVPELLHLASDLQIDLEFSAIRILSSQHEGTLFSRWLPQAQALTVPVSLECPLPNPPSADIRAMAISGPE